MAVAGLVMEPLPDFPVLWILGLVAFIGFLWYAWQDAGVARRAFLVLWLPASVAAVAVYKLDGHGQAVVDSLRLVLRADAATLRLVFEAATDGFAATYGLVVGGAAAVLGAVAVQVAGLVLGGLVGAGDRARRHQGGARARPARPARP